MIKTFKHKPLEAFHREGKKRGIQPDHINKLRKQLGLLEAVTSYHELKTLAPPGWNVHELTLGMKGYYAMWVSPNWRLMWKFDGSDVVELDYLDYH